ncbi:MAG TPA: 16S rRNA (cytosine(1402)-N(4))-methyltransferase RsmH, partial [Candidatus Berkiella sp.]|nr:16S rRNA (cytosine(1402)-N(4))-methyltransferase RsmH [Candidatus Berkiella sp.]
DPEAIAHAKAHIQDKRLECHHACFSELWRIVKAQNLVGKIDGILLDLGVSSPQLDIGERGFSFMRDGPLDMRMDPTRGISASEWLNHAPVEDIIKVLYEYGEESFAKKIAHKICTTRTQTPIETTKQLASLVAECVFVKKHQKHPATKTFQAIRIFINQEMQAIDEALNNCQDILAYQGRLVVISFHSLEDRKIKQFFRRISKVQLPKGIAIPEKDLQAPFKWVVKRQRPKEEELERNQRARSATLRVAEKALMS